MGSGPARGRNRRVNSFRALLPCLVLTALLPALADAQTLTPDMLRPVRGGFVSLEDSPLRKIAPARAEGLPEPSGDPRRTPDKPAPSRIGQLPTYGTPAANGAADVGYDSLNRKRKKPKYYPGQARPKPPVGPGSQPPPVAPVVSGRVRIAPPPSEFANKTPLPPAMAGTVAGQPLRKRLKLDDDPFGAVGDYAGSFLLKGAVELSTGYDTNPGRLAAPQGRPFYVIAPEFLAVSDWERHAVVADLRGSFNGYGQNLTPNADGTPLSAPLDIDRPGFTGHIDGRLDVSRDTRLTGQGRLLVATDNPGSPNVQAGLARYPIYTTVGATAGFDQNFNRLQVSGGATVDRTDYQWSKLTDGTKSSNDDRNFTQYGGIGRVSYEVMPGLKPFGEVQADRRVHDLYLDRNGYARNSTGGYVKAGSSFEFSRLLTGEIAVGWAERSYVDARLPRLQGLLTTASLVWTATPLTTAKYFSDTQLVETTLPGTAGILVRTHTFEVGHDFRRWLTGIGKFSYGTLDYQGNIRKDQTYSVSGDLIYKMNRNIWLKGTLRRDWLESNVPGSSTNSTVVMLGVRVQN
ncbi:outer membrane beta-barrel protein [Bradyrhizobium sp.]|uniref:outer membrane beta-barrel protein n=1 Tax=Bradyrhizobium sp. TaxID=376 RepID=UPI0040379C23